MKRICSRCQRPVSYAARDVEAHIKCVAKAAVHHAFLGCDTGCCGHEVVGYDDNGLVVYRTYDWEHPHSYEDHKTWATSLADHHLRGVPLDWEACDVQEC